MLQLYKNNVVTEATAAQADVRQMELDIYTNNYWVWSGTSTIVASFVFAQLSNAVPEGTNQQLEITYLLSTSLCLGFSLCVITWAVLCCIWGPGLALKGPNGMKSFHEAVDFLRDQQPSIYAFFFLSIVMYFICSCCTVWVYPSRSAINSVCMAVLGFFMVIVVFLQLRLECRIGGGLFPHASKDDPDGRIRGLEKFENLADLDNFMAQRITPEMAAQATVLQPGMHGTQVPGYSPIYNSYS